MKTFISTVLAASLILTISRATEEKAPDDLKSWAERIEKTNPVSDVQGHGPDIGSVEWLNAVDKQFEISDADGHGPDIGSLEWRNAVEKKIGKTELLSSHDTKATFSGLTNHKCLGLTSFCPDKCGHSGKLATFQITKYLAYEKPGEYGDAKQETFQFLIRDNMGNPKVPKNIAKAILALKPGDTVRLSWHHNYVTIDGSSSPERPILKIESLN